MNKATIIRKGLKLLIVMMVIIAPSRLLAADRQIPSKSVIIEKLKAQARQRPPAKRYEMGYQRINRKLSTIRFDEVLFDGMTLDEVVQYLSEEIRKKDPEKKGVNFMFARPPAVPNLAGLADLESVVINLRQPLRNLTALQVLDVVSKTADSPIKFAVNDYAIVVMPRAPGAPNVFNGRFRVNPDTFQQGLTNINATLAPIAGNRTSIPIIGTTPVGQGGNRP